MCKGGCRSGTLRRESGWPWWARPTNLLCAANEPVACWIAPHCAWRVFVKCSECRSGVVRRAKYCPQCGISLARMWLRRKCINTAVFQVVFFIALFVVGFGLSRVARGSSSGFLWTLLLPGIALLAFIIWGNLSDYRKRLSECEMARKVGCLPNGWRTLYNLMSESTNTVEPSCTLKLRYLAAFCAAPECEALTTEQFSLFMHLFVACNTRTKSKAFKTLSRFISQERAMSMTSRAEGD